MIGVLGIVTGLAIPFYQSFQISSALDNASHELIQGLRTAQSRSLSSQGLTSHGVHIDSGRFVVFSGSVYNPSAPENEIFEIPSTVSISSSGSDNILFSVVTGLPDSQPTITLESTNNESVNITINELGVVNAN